MTWLLDILRPFARFTVAKAAQVAWNTLEIGTGLRYRSDIPNERGILDIDPSAAQTFGSATVGDLAITGTLTQGPSVEKTSTGATTTGPASAPVLSLPLADNHGGTIRFAATGWAPGYGGISFTWAAGVEVLSGSFAGQAPEPTILSNACGLPVAVTVTWAAAVLSVVVGGPAVDITAAGASGGNVKLTVNGPIDAALVGQSITVAGLTTCTEANGAHTVTAVPDSTHIVLNVASVHTGSDSGTAVHTTPPVVAWSASGSLVAAP